MLFVLLDFSSADVKLVAAHSPVVNLSRRDILLATIPPQHGHVYSCFLVCLTFPALT